MNNTNLYLDLYGLHYYNEKLKKYVDDKEVKTDDVTISKNASGELEVTERFIQGLKDYISENYVPKEIIFAKLSLNNGEVVKLQGSGELTQAMITQYESSVVSAEIGKLCTSIGSFAFQGCSGLTSITIPNNVTNISQYAFSGCTSLTSITIPDSVTSIGDNVFSRCSSLTNIVVDSANTVFDSRDNCNAIIKTSTNELVVGCKSTVIPNTVTSIGDSVFYGCTGLTSITIPESVTSIGGSVFYGCTSLTSITIPNTVTSIGDNVFYNCSKLTSITSLAAKAPTIQSNTFRSVKTGGTLSVPSGSTGYDVWMGTNYYYLGYYNWTKVEQ